MGQKLQHIEQIDFLRALAVLLVIFFHIDESTITGGFLGVDVFFVISGYLITRLIKAEMENTGAFSFKNFYLKRIKRLFPTLFLVLILTFILSFLILSPSEFISTIKSIAYSSIALSNFHFLSESNYFDTSSDYKPLLHTWSLGIEEQFYLIWPISVFLLLKFLKKFKSLIIIISVLIISFISTIYISINGLPESIIGFFISDNDLSLRTDSIQFFLLPFRAFEFLIGGVLVFMPLVSLKKEISKISLNIIGVVLIVFSAFFFHEETPMMSSLNIIPCIGAGLIILFPPSKYFEYVYKLKLVKLLSKSSYTLYLFHWPIIVFYKHLTGAHFSVFEQIFLFVGSFLVSIFVYSYYENPLRYDFEKSTVKMDKILYGSLGTLMIVFFVLKFSITKNKGWLWRIDDTSIELMKKAKHSWGGSGYERVGFINENYKDEPVDMFWYGDSHASHYSKAIDSIFVKKNSRVAHMTNIRSLGLPEVINFRVDQTIIDKEQLEAVERMKRHPEATFILSYHWHAEKYSSKFLNKETGNHDFFQRNIDSYNIVYEKIDKFLDQIGYRKVIIIGDNPRKDNNELNTVNKILKPKYLKGISPNKSTFLLDPYIVDVNQSIKDYFKDRSNILFLDPSQVLCDNEVCIEQLGDKIYYNDDNHLSAAGSLRVLEFFEDEILNFLDIKLDTNEVYKKALEASNLIKQNIEKTSYPVDSVHPSKITNNFIAKKSKEVNQPIRINHNRTYLSKEARKDIVSWKEYIDLQNKVYRLQNFSTNSIEDQLIEIEKQYINVVNSKWPKKLDQPSFKEKLDKLSESITKVKSTIKGGDNSVADLKEDVLSVLASFKITKTQINIIYKRI